MTYILRLNLAMPLVDPFGAQSNNQERIQPRIEFWSNGVFSCMQIEEIAFPEPNDISKSALDKSRLTVPYHKQKLLGKGGMGMVWQVRDPICNVPWRSKFCLQPFPKIHPPECILMRKPKSMLSCSIQAYCQCTLMLGQIQKFLI